MTPPTGLASAARRDETKPKQHSTVLSRRDALIQAIAAAASRHSNAAPQAACVRSSPVPSISHHHGRAQLERLKPNSSVDSTSTDATPCSPSPSIESRTRQRPTGETRRHAKRRQNDKDRLGAKQHTNQSIVCWFFGGRRQGRRRRRWSTMVPGEAGDRHQQSPDALLTRLAEREPILYGTSTSHVCRPNQPSRQPGVRLFAAAEWTWQRGNAWHAAPWSPSLPLQTVVSLRVVRDARPMQDSCCHCCRCFAASDVAAAQLIQPGPVEAPSLDPAPEWSCEMHDHGTAAHVFVPYGGVLARTALGCWASLSLVNGAVFMLVDQQSNVQAVRTFIWDLGVFGAAATETPCRRKRRTQSPSTSSFPFLPSTSASMPSRQAPQRKGRPGLPENMLPSLPDSDDRFHGANVRPPVQPTPSTSSTFALWTTQARACFSLFAEAPEPRDIWVWVWVWVIHENSRKKQASKARSSWPGLRREVKPGDVICVGLGLRWMLFLHVILALPGGDVHRQKGGRQPLQVSSSLLASSRRRGVGDVTWILGPGPWAFAFCVTPGLRLIFLDIGSRLSPITITITFTTTTANDLARHPPVPPDLSTQLLKVKLAAVVSQPQTHVSGLAFPNAHIDETLQTLPKPLIAFVPHVSPCPRACSPATLGPARTAIHHAQTVQCATSRVPRCVASSAGRDARVRLSEGFAEDGREAQVGGGIAHGLHMSVFEAKPGSSPGPSAWEMVALRRWNGHRDHGTDGLLALKERRDGV
ncbi:hypothetical protein G7046_g5694 [Stylonectria norvegica]|nr:hypothetical protein G7046_g5694 [Stylonectria norvegica]